MQAGFNRTPRNNRSRQPSRLGVLAGEGAGEVGGGAHWAGLRWKIDPLDPSGANGKSCDIAEYKPQGY